MTATLWRIRWETSVLEWYSEWSQHFDSVRNHADELAEAMPGANVRMESATVTDVGDIDRMDFNGALDHNGEPDISHPFTATMEDRHD